MQGCGQSDNVLPEQQIVLVKNFLKLYEKYPYLQQFGMPFLIIDAVVL